MRYFRRVNPVGGISDFWSYIRQPQPYRWAFLLVSLLACLGLISILTHERVFMPPEQPEVEYIRTFAADRTDEEIRQSNLENQRLKEERQAELDRIEQEKRDLYRRVGAATGIDTTEAEARAEAERAAAERAERERLERLFGEQNQETDAAVADEGE
ncbi:hypothetical protein K3179_07700 [Qipengyuania sp. GH38]|uniref:hypothetical protein n=1 Tax=Qipengyuania intermedia TaxID=2867244 RepID=UPI001C8677C4|nr:hypothetical protein [Qipengyuania intermedia]MBX7514432.1 hypothetical protein [Qipengyuania intermedia]